MTSWSLRVVGLTSTPKPLKLNDLSNETPPSNPDNNVPYQFDHDFSTLAFKLRNHQIFDATKSSAAVAAAAIMLQQQLFMSRGAGVEAGESSLIQMPLSLGAGAGESSLIQMPLTLGASDDVVDGSSSSLLIRRVFKF